MLKLHLFCWFCTFLIFHEFSILHIWKCFHPIISNHTIFLINQLFRKILISALYLLRYPTLFTWRTLASILYFVLFTSCLHLNSLGSLGHSLVVSVWACPCGGLSIWFLSHTFVSTCIRFQRQSEWVVPQCF